MVKRKTDAEREAEWSAAEARVWVRFRGKLEAAAGHDEALAISLDTQERPAPDAPGYRYYSNLAFFLGTFTVPGGSGHEERALYLELVRRIDAAAELKPGVMERVERDLATE